MDKVATVVEIYEDGRVLTYIDEHKRCFWFNPQLLQLLDEKDEKRLSEASKSHGIFSTM